MMVIPAPNCPWGFTWMGSYQLVSSLRDGVPSSLSGRKSISFMMLANLTGSSCLRNTNEVFSQALAEPADTGQDRGDTHTQTMV